jgi:hypothetical protein
MLTKQLSPDANTSSSTTTATTQTTKKVRLLPRKDADLDTLATAVAAKWKTLPQLTLLWTTQAIFEGMASNYNTTLSARLKAGGNRPSKTVTLKSVNASIDNAVKIVRGYIVKKYETEAAAIPQYARFGITKPNGYMMAKDNDDRKKALQLMKAAIVEDGFATEKYGTAFWDATIADFEAAVSASATVAKTISTEVDKKDVLRADIEAHLDAIIHLVKANYPKTWESELRAWGFLKGNY